MNLYRLAAAFCATALILFSCSQEEDVSREEAPSKEKEWKEVIITASLDEATQPDTRTSLVTENGEIKEVLWSPGDSVKLFSLGEDAAFVSINTTPTRVARFKGMIPFITGADENGEISYIYGLYPYRADATYSETEPGVSSTAVITTTLPHIQTGKAGTFDDGYAVTLGRSESLSVPFRTVYTLIRFSLTRDDITSVSFKGNNGEPIAGRFKVGMQSKTSTVPEVKGFVSPETEITMKMADGSAFEAGPFYYFVMLPTTFSDGFTLTLTRSDGRSGDFVIDGKSLTLSRNKFSSISDLDTRVAEWKIDWSANPEVKEDLSAEGTANSYIVPSAGIYSFDASVKGNGTEPLSGSSAEVLWESFGTSVAPEVGDIISSVNFKDGRIYFSTPDVLKDGNAVIALKDASGTIIWSWHIWVCKDFDPDATGQTYANDAGVLMDRNLGALSSIPGDDLSIGLLYQWGRKDPFLSTYSLSKSSLAVATPSFPSPQSTTASVEYTVNNPNVFISFSSFNWLNVNDNTLWEGEKTIYDPCPPGWKIPKGGQGGFFSRAFGSSSISGNLYWNGSYHGMIIPAEISGSESWFPGSGSRAWSGASLVGAGDAVDMYTSTYADTYSAYWLYAGTDYFETVSSGHKVDARSIRCVKEGTDDYPTTIAVSSISLDKSTITLQVGGTSTLVATVLPENATDKSVTWSSSNTSVATVDANGKVTAVGKGTATITAKVGDKTATCTVTVTVPVTGVSLDKTTMTLSGINSTGKLTATITPSNASNTNVTWSSSNTAVATVSNGTVTAKGAGTATITVTTADGSKTATCTVTVTIPVTSISLNKTTLSLTIGASETLTATIAPTTATNKNVTWSSSNTAVATVDANGKVSAVSAGSATITVTTVDGSKKATCTVTVNPISGGREGYGEADENGWED